jgi:hypothetical protein
MRGRSGAVWDVDAQQRQRDRLSSGVVRHVGRAKVRKGEEGQRCKSEQRFGRATFCDVFAVGWRRNAWKLGMAERPIGGRESEECRL